MRVDAAGTSPHDRLAVHAQVGDLILIGSGDVASRIIQYGSWSRFSHAAVVTDDQLVTEAYDYSLTLAEDDEGVYHTHFSDFLARPKKLRTVMVLRPSGVDIEKLQAAARNLHRDSPPYPTFGALLLSVCRIFSETVPLLAEGLFGQQRIGRRLHRRLDRFAESQVRFIGDGARKIHCAESVLWLYEQAGVTVELSDAVLWRSMARAKPLDPATGQHRPTRSRRRTGLPPVPHRSANVVMRAILRAHKTVEGVPRVLRRRRRNMHIARPGDYAFPADFENTKPFEKIDEFTVLPVGRRLARLGRRRPPLRR